MSKKVIGYDFKKKRRVSPWLDRMLMFTEMYHHGELNRYFAKDPGPDCYSEKDIQCFRKNLSDEDKLLKSSALFTNIYNHVWLCDRCLAFLIKENEEGY